LSGRFEGSQIIAPDGYREMHRLDATCSAAKCPISENELKQPGVDLHQQETIGIFVFRVDKLRFVNMWFAPRHHAEAHRGLSRMS
jgi:hypothetical protein